MAVSVNVSARQFREKNLVARVASALKESGLDAKYLELELTESLIMQDIEVAVATRHIRPPPSPSRPPPNLPPPR
jgi:EAL domain-containing protein (putative c-di-GMP-specific phosphodiesterase class I)